MLRIIDNKKIDLTDEEWRLYQEICKSYDIERRGIQGKDLFIDLFETDEQGIITFLKPPKTLTSMEVYMFLVSVMIHQHLGAACEHVNTVISKLSSKINEIDQKILEVNKILNREKEK